MQVVDINHRNAERCSKALCKGHTHKQRTHQAGTSRKGNGRELLTFYASLLQGCVHDRHNVLLMGTARQFGHHTAVSFMYRLAGRNVAQQNAIAQYCR